MTLVRRNITLRPVCEDDMPLLFRLLADPRRCHLWMQGRQIHDEREFHAAWASWTADVMGGKFIVVRGEKSVGLVFEYKRLLEDGHSRVTALLDEQSVGQGVGVLAATMLIDWIFQTIPVRKVYMEVYGYNARVVDILRKLELAEEAILPEHRFWDGRYWSKHMFAAVRCDWPRIRRRLLRSDHSGNDPERVTTSKCASSTRLSARDAGQRFSNTVHSEGALSSTSRLTGDQSCFEMPSQ